MKNVNIILVVFLLMAGFGCVKKSSKPFSIDDDKKIPVIDIEKVIKGKEQVYLLSDIASDIEYIPLEFKPECPLKIDQWWDLHVSSTDIFVLSTIIYRFDRYGKFLNTIGALGRGPGEFSLAVGFAVDTVARHVYLHSNERQIHVYNYHGKHIRSMPINHTIFRGFYFIGETNELFYAGQETYALRYPNNYVIKSTDTLANILFSKNALVAAMLKEGEAQSYSSSTMQNGDEILAIDGMSDTLFCYRQSTLVPYLILNYGKYKLTIDAMRSFHYGTDFGKCFQTRIYGSTNDYLFIYLYQTKIPEPRKRIYLRYDKNKGECTYGANTIVNDLDGGMPARLPHNFRNQWIFAYDAFDMIEELTPEHLASSKAKNTQAQKRLQQMVKNLKEEDNPVLMRIILKP